MSISNKLLYNSNRSFHSIKFFYMEFVTVRPIFKKPILNLKIESKLRIAGMPTEYLFKKKLA